MKCKITTPSWNYSRLVSAFFPFFLAGCSTVGYKIDRDATKATGLGKLCTHTRNTLVSLVTLMSLSSTTQASRAIISPTRGALVLASFCLDQAGIVSRWCCRPSIDKNFNKWRCRGTKWRILLKIHWQTVGKSWYNIFALCKKKRQNQSNDQNSHELMVGFERRKDVGKVCKSSIIFAVN